VSGTWADASRERLRTAVAAAVAKVAAAHGAPTEPAAPPDAAYGALDRIADSFGLDEDERLVLALCAGIEVSAAARATLARIHGDPHAVAPTIGLLAGAGVPLEALAPEATLRKRRLVHLVEGRLLHASELRVDERVLHALLGARASDPILAPLLRAVPPPRAAAPSLVAAASRAGSAGVTWLTGRSGIRAKAAVAALAGLRDGRGVLCLAASDVPADAGAREELARRLDREALLEGAALLIDAEEDGARAASRLAERLSAPTFVAAPEACPLERASTRIDVPRPDATEQAALWADALGERAGAVTEPLRRVVAQFDLSAEDVHAVAEELAGLDGAALGEALWSGCRSRSRQRLEELAQRIDPAAGWDDLVLPAAQKQVLSDVIAHVRQRTRVYDDWGWRGRGGRGLGIAALFAGVSGTGKTMAAEVLARTLDLDLYRIDLSALVSKYIGETEKNLRRVFDAAESGGAILLFDEADALFGKRSEVRDSHDRYANIEVSYLLQRMDEYRGLAILTTNLPDAIDRAFLRRIRFVVHFPFPDAEQRAAIWRGVFPKGVPTEALDVARLARLNIAGGNIRNIALAATFLAADNGEPVRMRHLARAAAGELAKLGQPLADLGVAR
jgi:hypothetical protein